jgi:enterochelin esterase family protein
MKSHNKVILSLIFVLVLICADVSPARGQTAGEQAILSPRLKRLKSELEKQGPRLEAFWQEITGRGTPLVEPIENSDRHVYVTFLWKGGGETKNVVILTSGNSQLGNAEYFPDALLSNLPGTNVWFKTYRMRNDARFGYRMAQNDSLDVLKDFKLDPKRAAAFKPDPLNNRHYTGFLGESSVVELDHAPLQIWIDPMPGVPEGKVEKLPFKSRILNNDRTIWVYTPAGYSNSRSDNNLLIKLGGDITGVPLPTILNNLIGKGKLPPTVAVAVDWGPGGVVTERWHNDKFNDFVAQELIPWVRKNYRVTARAGRTFLTGASLSANTAVYLGIQHPEIFGNVMAQSGGFAYRQRQNTPRPPLAGDLFEEDFPESEWLIRQIVARPKMPMRFYLEIGLMEEVVWREVPARYAFPSLVASTRHLRDVLQAKGYDVFYNEYNGAHEDLSWRGTYGEGLILLAGGKSKSK